MAVTKTIPNALRYEMGLGGVNFSSHTFKAILLNDSFVFDEDSHGYLADVSSSIISSAGGYAALTLTIDTAWAQDNTNDKANVIWDNVTFTASGAAFDAFCAMIVYDDSHASDVIIGCAEFNQTITVPDGASFLVENVSFEITKS